MKFKELKPILADRISKVSMLSEDYTKEVNVDFTKLSGEQAILKAIEGNELSDLDEFTVEHVFVGNSGFIVNFKYNTAVEAAFLKLSKEYRIPMDIRLYPAD